MKETELNSEASGGIIYESKTLEAAMRITTKGQVTIPREVRERLGLLPHTEVEFSVRGDTAVLTKAGTRRKGALLIDHMRGRIAKRVDTEDLLEHLRGPMDA